MIELFHRNGTPVPTNVTIHSAAKSRYYTEPKVCGRCGGVGGSEAWARTGYTCYQCGGHRFVGTHDIKVYTSAQLEKLNAAAAKRQIKKDAELAAKRAAAQAEADARRETFMAEHGALLLRAKRLVERSEFIFDIVAKAEASAALTHGQIAALTKVVDSIEANDAKRAAAGYIGTVGKRERNITATVTFSYQLPRFRYSDAARFITVMETEDGNFIQVKSSAFAPRKGSVVTFDATVKDHIIYRGTKQTTMQRVDVKTCIRPEEDMEKAA